MDVSLGNESKTDCDGELENTAYQADDSEGDSAGITRTQPQEVPLR